MQSLIYALFAFKTTLQAKIHTFHTQNYSVIVGEWKWNINTKLFDGMTSPFLFMDGTTNGKNQEGGKTAHNIGGSWPGSEESPPIHTLLVLMDTHVTS